MSVTTALAKISTIQNDLRSLQNQLSTAVSDRASKAKQIAQVRASINSSTSTYTVKSKTSEIQRLEADVVRLMQREADFTKRIATKHEELAKAQKQYYDEQGKEQGKLQKSLETLSLEESSRREANLNRAVSGMRELDGDGIVGEDSYHAFISHASEDKEEVVRPLADALTERGFNVWYDEFQLKVGDSLRRSIDKGLSRSRFGIVVLSPSFFDKQWPQYEL